MLYALPVVVIMVVPVAILVPAISIDVPPAVMVVPAVFAGFV